MKTISKIFFLLFLFLCLNARGQVQQILAMSMEVLPPTGDTTQYGVPIIDSTTVFTASMLVTLDNTDSIYRLHVSLGSTLHGTDHLSTAFDYGVNGTFGSTSYSQSGNTVTLGLGTFSGLQKYYAEVQIEKTDHSFEDAILFTRQ